MVENNGKVTTREFYVTLQKMDERVNKRLDKLLEGQSKSMTMLEAHEKRLDKHEEDIESLERSDKRWVGFSGIIAVVAGAIAGFFGGK